ncbi:hypothetical protein QBC44DRAFT_379856 [Cladorrhinum sp. PSN332]|nr:hypothetical protein QBC44DRAFT_379856 [Cladorrhinum sp. PSN332]
MAWDGGARKPDILSHGLPTDAQIWDDWALVYLVGLTWPSQSSDLLKAPFTEEQIRNKLHIYLFYPGCPQSSDHGLGRLEKFPEKELLRPFLCTLPVRRLWMFRQLNRRARAAVSNLREYRIVARLAPQFLRALCLDGKLRDEKPGASTIDDQPESSDFTITDAINILSNKYCQVCVGSEPIRGSLWHPSLRARVCEGCYKKHYEDDSQVIMLPLLEISQSDGLIRVGHISRCLGCAYARNFSRFRGVPSFNQLYSLCELKFHHQTCLPMQVVLRGSRQFYEKDDDHSRQQWTAWVFENIFTNHQVLKLWHKELYRVPGSLQVAGEDGEIKARYNYRHTLEMALAGRLSGFSSLKYLDEKRQEEFLKCLALWKLFEGRTYSNFLMACEQAQALPLLFGY